jgi:diacylglycerol kinase family enzyme
VRSALRAATDSTRLESVTEKYPRPHNPPGSLVEGKVTRRGTSLALYQGVPIMALNGASTRRLGDTHPLGLQALDGVLAGRSRVAVLLNANAKSVNAQVRRSLARVVPDEHLYVSRTEEEASAIAEAVVSRRYSTVFTGGGDGTFVGWVNRILESAARRATPAPRFGVLALGTGNAVAEMVGATPRRHAEDLARFVRGEVGSVRRLDLVTCEGRRTPFAGAGIDAAVLNDYGWIRRRLAGTLLAQLGVGLPGYGLAIALRSAPRRVMERPTYCEIQNSGGPAWRLDSRGVRIGRPIAHGELLYAGPCMLAAAGTVPYYGLGLRVFPFAGTAPGSMQLRVATSIGLATLLTNLPSIWSGSFAHPGLVDFHAERVALRFDRPTPLQIGGDAEGLRREVTMGMASQPVELVDFAAAA